MNIALIFPRTRYPSGQPPLGILSLAAYLRRESDVQVDIFDLTFHKNPFDYLRDGLSAQRYDMVGVSVMTSMVRDAEHASAIARQTDPQALVIWGGPHATVLPAASLALPDVDAVAIGEAEETLLELVQQGGDPTDVAGIWHKTADGSIVQNPPRPLIRDLSSLPWPARDLVDMRTYARAWYSLTAADPTLLGTSVITSRGCPYGCTYCQPTLRYLFGKKVRRRSVDDVLDELVHLKEVYDLNAFMFEDDTFIIHRPWVKEFSAGLKEMNLGFRWGCNVRADLTTRDLLQPMVEAGLVQINVGIESGTQRILDQIYDKRITIEDVRRAVDIAKSLGLKVGGYFMIGAPTEREEEIENTIRFAAQLPIDEAAFNITTPLPGTYLWEQTQDLVGGDIAEFDYYHTSVYNSPQVLPAKKLEWLKRKAYLRFYLLSPRRVPNVLKWSTSRLGIHKMLLRMKRF
jgi:anaerobic magnesium-protoporphyrin IX monomethyl ester cyclase